MSETINLKEKRRGLHKFLEKKNKGNKADQLFSWEQTMSKYLEEVSDESKVRTLAKSLLEKNNKAYSIRDYLNRGGCSFIYETDMKDDVRCVIKVSSVAVQCCNLKVENISKSAFEDYITHFTNEVEVCNEINKNPYCVEIYDSFSIPYMLNGVEVDRWHFIVMKYYEKTLRKWYVDHVPDAEETGYIMSDILNALIPLHEKHFVHRDIKPENIFVEERDDRMHFLLGDFGIAKVIKGLDMMSRGTPTFAGPELALHKKADFRYDLCTVALLVYYKYNKYCMPDWSEISGEAPETEIDLGIFYDIVMKAIKRNPDERFENARVMLQELQSIMKCLDDDSDEEEKEEEDFPEAEADKCKDDVQHDKDEVEEIADDDIRKMYKDRRFNTILEHCIKGNSSVLGKRVSAFIMMARDIGQAQTMYKELIDEHGDSFARYITALKFTQNDDEAFEEILSLAEEGYPPAEFEVAKNIYMGKYQYRNKSLDEAVELADKAYRGGFMSEARELCYHICKNYPEYTDKITIPDVLNKSKITNGTSLSDFLLK